MDEEHHDLISGHSNKRGPSLCCKIVVVMAILIPTALFLASLAAIIALSLRVMDLSNSNKTSPHSSEPNTTSNVCLSSSCIQLASTVSQYMNTSFDPCQDFYNYSCGGWEAMNVIPSGYGTWGVFNELDQRNNIAIKKLLDGMEESNVQAVQLARKLYESCLDTGALTGKGAEPLTDLLSITGGWDAVGVKNSM